MSQLVSYFFTIVKPNLLNDQRTTPKKPTADSPPAKSISYGNYASTPIKNFESTFLNGIH